MAAAGVTTVSIPAAVKDNGAALPSDASTVNFGPNVLILDPSMTNIQAQVDAIFTTQQTNQFGQQRYAIFFKPGAYSANVQVGFYTTVHGLGSIPDDVTITGGVNVTATWNTGNATQNFWRGIENLAVVPTVWSNSAMFATSQATWLRRCHYKGYLQLFDFTASGVNFSSGGFVADTIVDNDVISGSQQQYLTRNTQWSNWFGAVWNMVFVGDTNPPSGTWPAPQFTVVANTPVIREKPYLTIDSSNNYSVVVPALKQNSKGPSWNATTTLGTAPTTIPISRFYVAKAANDNAETLNLALQRGRHLLLTPGVYNLTQPIVVRNANTVVFGIGLATLAPTQGTPAIIVADVPGVTIAGILFDAGASNSPNLLQIGDVNVSYVDHSANPTALFDISCRVGGAAPTAETTSCIVINSKNVIIDNAWIWRADHGDPTGWTINPATNGIIVNSDNVTAYGLFVEHFEGFQTLWNGNGGSVFLYQSECPYDVPSQAQWTQNGENGYPSYKVSNSVTSHDGWGIGVYCFFANPVQLDNAIETPTGAGITMNHLVTVFLGSANAASSINHIINGTGAAVNSTSKTSFSST